VNTVNSTHVLVWVPPYLLEGGGDGGWDLWVLRDFETGTTRDYPPGTDLPRDTDPGLLAQWVAAHLGYPVALAPGVQEIRLHWWSRWHTRPIYYVQPAQVTS